MRTSVLSVLFLLAPLASPGAAQGLTRVAPGQQSSLPDVLAREFKREEWRAALEAQDLDQREKGYDALLARARLDPVARAFVEELARDPAAGELAWTARLLLRELGRASFPATSPLFGSDPLGMAGRMDAMLQELMQGGGMPGSIQRLPKGRANGLGLESLGGRSVRVQQTESGAKVEVLETIDGREERRTYEGSNLGEILRANPELERELGGLSVELAPGQSLQFGLRSPGAGRGAASGSVDGRTFATPFTPKPKAPVQTDKLGVVVQALTAEHATELGLAADQGLYVERVQPGSYADLLGVASGAVLLTLDGAILSTPADLERAMKARTPAADLKLAWIDADGKRHEETWKAR